jgi:hypothetical protein
LGFAVPGVIKSLTPISSAKRDFKALNIGHSGMVSWDCVNIHRLEFRF